MECAESVRAPDESMNEYPFPAMREVRPTVSSRDAYSRVIPDVSLFRITY
jgi:hypothetical protein